jgi:hypothetical protein
MVVIDPFRSHAYTTRCRHKKGKAISGPVLRKCSSVTLWQRPPATTNLKKTPFEGVNKGGMFLDYRLLQPLQTGKPFSSRTFNISVPFFTSAAIMVGFP